VIREAFSPFLRLSIAKKLFLGFFTITLLIFVISAFSLSTLVRLNDYNATIISTYQPLIEATDKMIDAVLSQELFGRRYALLMSPENLMLFWEKKTSFENLVDRVRSLPDIDDPRIEKLSSLHADYNAVFLEGMVHLREPGEPTTRNYDNEIKIKQELLINTIKGIASQARQQQNESTVKISEVAMMAFRIMAILCLSALLLSLLATALITRSIARPIRQLKLATRDIAEGKFDIFPNVNSRDEIGDLAHSFRDMAQRLKRLEEMYIDASPLTRLPGNIAIENVLKKRLESGARFAFCHIDLDNFKAFNDRYGYARGSELIKATANIIETVVSQKGEEEDFTGHIGGDDFVIITTPSRYVNLCKGIIASFDKRIAEFYDLEDLRNGYIVSKTRQGDETRYPIMTISLSVVTNIHRELTSTVEIGEIAAELKHYAKSVSRSIYVVDKRRNSLHVEPAEDNVVKLSRRIRDQESK